MEQLIRQDNRYTEENIARMTHEIRHKFGDRVEKAAARECEIVVGQYDMATRTLNFAVREKSCEDYVNPFEEGEEIL